MECGIRRKLTEVCLKFCCLFGGNLIRSFGHAVAQLNLICLFLIISWVVFNFNFSEMWT